MGDRRIEYVNVEELTGAPRNPKDHDEETLDASLERFGYIEPIVRDDRTGRLISGHGRTEAIRRRKLAGGAPPEGVEVAPDGRWVVPVMVGWASRDDAEAEAAVIALNRIGERGGWKRDVLAEMLAEMGDGPGLAGVGYDRSELDGGDPDPRKLLVRTFRGDNGEGVARAVLSDGYKIIDNLDVLTAALEGIRDAGVTVRFQGCDLTERRMYVRIEAPEVQALAPTLLRGYRSPYSGNSGDENPTVFAGFVLSNSETGGGAFQITPRLVVQVCNNGLTMTKDAMRAVHLGGKMDEGVIRWSDETQRKNLDLVASQARDAVATFLDVDYMTMVIDRIEAQAEVELAKPAEAVQLVGQRLRFSEERTAGILDHFIRGGQVTAGGLLNAVTSYAQSIEDADEAMEMEAQAVRAMELAASIR